MRQISISKLLKNGKHAEKIESERAAVYQFSSNAEILTHEQVKVIEDLLANRDFQTAIPFVLERYLARGLYNIWSGIVKTTESSFSPVDAFSLCLNSLLCTHDEYTHLFVQEQVIDGLMMNCDFIVDGMKNIGYYRDSYDAVVFEPVNMVRGWKDELIKPEVLKAFGDLKLTEALIESAIRFEDLDAVNYCLRHLVHHTDHNTVLRKCLRVKGVTKAFTAIALREHTSVDGFAQDIIAAVKIGSLAQLERVYDEKLAGKCYHELIIHLMSDNYLSDAGIQAVQSFVRMVIESGFDTYPTFVDRYYGKFAAIDQMAKPRLTPHQILDRIMGKQHMNSAASLDAFLPSIKPEEILHHQKSSYFFDRQHAMTKDHDYLQKASNKYKGQHLSNEIGI